MTAGKTNDIFYIFKANSTTLVSGYSNRFWIR
jgi:hypothetical protein